MTSFLKSKGVDIILLDTDGDCNELIPLFMEAGITGLYPMEASAGMDVLAARKKYPDLQILGGVPKSRLVYGKNEIDRFLEPIAELLKSGGYIPHGDHLIPPDVSWEDFRYYRDKLNHLIDNLGKL
jgi:uroporphyrinogen decarboxylase